MGLSYCFKVLLNVDMNVKVLLNVDMNAEVTTLEPDAGGELLLLIQTSDTFSFLTRTKTKTCTHTNIRS